MDGPNNPETPGRKSLAELSALADGTLDPEREPAVRELIARSPELRERYERELRAVRALGALRADRAPERLRARIEAERGRPRGRTWPRLGLGYGTALAGAVVVAIVAIVLLLPAGTPGAPSVSQAASLAQRGAAFPAPLPGGKRPDLTLARDVQEVYFPNWSALFGWRAVGQRVDHLNGRLAVTVYYARQTKRIAYTIVSAPALKVPSATSRWLDGTELKSFVMGERQVVTWQRAGHTCVLSGDGVSPAELSRLASWKVAGTAVS
jgi:anti-sigma factor RsiW